MSFDRWLRWLGVALLAALLGGVLVASGSSHVLVLNMIEGPDPIPQVLWLPSSLFGLIDPQADDARPDVSYGVNAVTVVWSKLKSGSFDVALSRWNGSQWEPVQYLTNTAGNDLDARVSVDGSVTRVVWWVGGTEAVQLLTSQGSGWGAAEFVTAPGATGRRPSVALWAGAELVSYERDPTGSGQQIVLAQRDPGGVFSEQVLFNVTRTKPLDAKLHSEQGHLWIDWKHSDSQFAYSERIAGTWTAPETVAWNDASWNGEERARAFIRGQVLAQ
jgi:hypothetical protein